MDLFNLLFLENLIIEDRYINPRKSDYENFKAVFQNTNIVNQLMQLRTKPMNTKSFSYAENLRIDGNLHFKRDNFAKALDNYNTSLSQAPVESVVYGLALGNRSAVLFCLEKYKECLLDINHVLKSQFPLHRRYNIFIRQANCLLELKSFDSAKKAIENAHSSFITSKSKIPEELHPVVLRKIAHIEERISIASKNSVSEVVKYEDDYVLPSLKNGENPKFINASSAVDIKKNSRQGRYVVANCKIMKGDVLFVEQPYGHASANTSESNINYCKHCLKHSLVCLPCHTCTIYFYCSEICRQASWDAEHRWICPRVMILNFSYEIHLVLSVLFRASRTGFNTIVEDNNVFGNKDDNYPYVHTLVTHPQRTEDYNEYVLRAVQMVVYLIYETDYFDWLLAQPNRPSGSREQLILIFGAHMVKHLRQIKYNKNIIKEIRIGIDEEKPDKPTLIYFNIAVGLFVSTSLLNHACNPNAAVSYHAGYKVVVAIKDIEKGREVAVSYISEDGPLEQENRQRFLRENYFFTCTCSRCTDSDMLFAWKCPKCHGPALATETTATCKNCSHKFVLRNYVIQRLAFINHYNSYLITNNFALLEAMERIMKVTFWSRSLAFFLTYDLMKAYYKAQGNMKMYCAYYKLLISIEELYIAPEAMLSEWIQYTFVISKYAKHLKQKKSRSYSKTLQQATQTIEKSMNILRPFANERCVNRFYQQFTEYLNSDEPLKIDYIYGCDLSIQE